MLLHGYVWTNTDLLANKCSNLYVYSTMYYKLGAIRNHILGNRARLEQPPSDAETLRRPFDANLHD